MLVNNKTLTRWRRMYDTGDKKELVGYTGYSNVSITSAFRGIAPKELIEKINEFYNKREEKLKELNIL